MHFSGSLFTIVCAFSFVRSVPINSRIINGTEATADYPWVARIVDNLTPTPDGKSQSVETDCGGTLIASNWVLTAKHCLLEKDLSPVGDPSKYAVIVGNNYWPSGQYITVTNFYLYSNTSYIDDDIALLKLSSAPKGVDPIPVQYEELSPESYDGELAHILGWGNTDPTRDTTQQQLRETYVQLYTDGCDPDSVLCFDPDTTQTNSCQGDSGGPMTLMLNNVETLVGVAHVGEIVKGVPCSGDFSTYTKTFYPDYAEWIQNTMAEN